MGSEAHAARDVVEPMHGEHRLAGGSLNLLGVLFCIVTGAAPITAMAFNVPVAVLGAGWAVPASFLVATVVLTIFSVGYIEMARRVSAAGGFYSFISHGFGQVLGMGAASTIMLSYVVFSASVSGVTGYFASTTLDAWFGISIPAWIIVLVLLAAMSALAWFHIELTSKILGVALVGEMILLTIFTVAVLIQGGHDGLSLDPWNPANIFDADANGALLGAAGIALFGAFWSWVGFEMAPNYAEESKEPKKIMASATYASVIGLGVVYMLVSWAFVSGWGLDRTSEAIGALYVLNDSTILNGEASPFYPLAQEFVGTWAKYGFELLVVTGSFACQLAFYNTASRYIYSMGREKIIPSAFGRVHPHHRSPYVASMAVSALMLVFILGFILHDRSTLAMLAQLGTWGPLLGVMCLLAIQTLCSLAIIRYFLTEARDGFHWFKTLVAPLIGGGGCGFAAFLMLKYRVDLAAGNPAFVNYVWLWAAIFFVVGVAVALYYKSASPERYQAIGRYVHEDAPAG